MQTSLDLRGAVILAPSCSGKSTLARLHPDTTVDGDHLIAQVGGWPNIHRFWEVLSKEQKYDLSCYHRTVIRRYLTENPSRIVFFNTSPRAVWEQGFVVVWVPSELELRMNAISRVDSGNTSQPSDIDGLLASRETYMRWALNAKIPMIATSQLTAYLASLGEEREQLFTAKVRTVSSTTFGGSAT